MTSVQILGRSLDISVERGAEGYVGQVQSVIQASCLLLNGQAALGQLNPTMLQYIQALRGLGVAVNRGFTACTGTGGQNYGLYVFYIGYADVMANPDPFWYASTIIHDGGHAWLSQNRQPACGVPVEKALTQVQIDYYNAVGGHPTYIDFLRNYMNDTPMILARINQDIATA